MESEGAGVEAELRREEATDETNRVNLYASPPRSHHQEPRFGFFHRELKGAERERQDRGWWGVVDRTGTYLVTNGRRRAIDAVGWTKASDCRQGKE